MVLNDSDRKKEFIERLIASTTNNNTDQRTLCRRHLAALRALSKNNNIIITPSDKGGCVFIMNSTEYNNKIENNETTKTHRTNYTTSDN